MVQLKTNAGTHVQRQTKKEFDLSVTKNQLTIKKANAGAHVQSQTRFDEFYLSLTEIEFFN